MVSCVFVHVCVFVQRLRRQSVGYGGQADEDNMDSYQPLGQGKHMPIYIYMYMYMYMYIHVYIYRGYSRSKLLVAILATALKKL